MQSIYIFNLCILCFPLLSLLSLFTHLCLTSLPQFNFFNCFASLFYIAFAMQDMVLLRQVGSFRNTIW